MQILSRWNGLLCQGFILVVIIKCATVRTIRTMAAPEKSAETAVAKSKDKPKKKIKTAGIKYARANQIIKGDSMIPAMNHGILEADVFI